MRDLTDPRPLLPGGRGRRDHLRHPDRRARLRPDRPARHRSCPLLAWLLLRRTERDVWVRRNVSALAGRGRRAPPQVEVEVGNAGSGAPASCCSRRSCSPALGAPPAVRASSRWRPGEQSMRCATRSTPQSRGRYPVGPLHVRVGDPTRHGRPRPDGLPRRRRILVTPRTEPLPRIPLTGRWAGAGDDRTRDLLGGGSPDVTIREYRLGDDLRRIHWPTSARTDELMVRREEQQWQSRCTLLHRQPADRPPRLRHGVVDGARGQRRRLDHARPGRPGLRGPAGQRDRPARPRTAGTRAPAGPTCPSSSSGWR